MTELIVSTDDLLPDGRFSRGRGGIVRCRDCEHYEDYTGCCTRRDYVAPMAATPDGFCAWGVRKEGGE